jgi:hypothetical protein
VNITPELIAWGFFSLFMGAICFPTAGGAAWIALRPRSLWAPFRWVIAMAIMLSAGYLVYGVLPEIFDLTLRQDHRDVMESGIILGQVVGALVFFRLFKKQNALGWLPREDEDHRAQPYSRWHSGQRVRVENEITVAQFRVYGCIFALLIGLEMPALNLFLILFDAMPLPISEFAVALALLGLWLLVVFLFTEADVIKKALAIFKGWETYLLVFVPYILFVGTTSVCKRLLLSIYAAFRPNNPRREKRLKDYGPKDL